jgi:hypothetical protein
MNKLGHYIFKRICKDQLLFRKTKPMNTYGLYVNGKDIQRYVNDYHDYGVDYMGCADDKVEHYLNGFLEGDWQIDNYWDEPEGKED